MKSKKILVIGFALVFFAFAANSIFANNRDGVWWFNVAERSSLLSASEQGHASHHMQVTNLNDHVVFVELSGITGGSMRRHRIEPGQTRHFASGPAGRLVAVHRSAW